MASGHLPVRLDSYIIKFAYSISIPMDALEKHLENATAKGASQYRARGGIGCCR